jgi:hypothetical protein
MSKLRPICKECAAMIGPRSTNCPTRGRLLMLQSMGHAITGGGHGGGARGDGGQGPGRRDDHGCNTPH